MDPKAPSSERPKVSTFFVLSPSITEDQIRISTSKLHNAFVCLCYEIHTFYPRFKRKTGLKSVVTFNEEDAAARRMNPVTRINEIVSRYCTLKGDLNEAKGQYVLDLKDRMFLLKELTMLPHIINPRIIIELDVRDNKLVLLDGIYALQELTYLNCYNNQIRDNDLSDLNVLKLPKLRYLNLGKNRLLSIPDCSHLPKLEYCWLTSNQIESIKTLHHPGLSGCKRLQMLDLTYNFIVIPNPAHMEFCLSPWSRLSLAGKSH